MALRILADLVLLLHLAVVVFVIGGLAAVVLGHRQGWAWVRNLPFRLAHLAAIGVVAAQAWLGQVCPLTTLESWLRVQAGGLGYQRGFIEHWVHAVLFHEAPPWVFTLAYTLFALLVALAWWRCPPRRHQAWRHAMDVPSRHAGDGRSQPWRGARAGPGLPSASSAGRPRKTHEHALGKAGREPAPTSAIPLDGADAGSRRGV